MIRFPLEGLNPALSAELLRQAGEWGVDNAGVEVPQLPRLLQTVRDVSKTPSGARLANTYRSVHLWDDLTTSGVLPPAGAAALFLACRREARALLELGYPRNAGIDFITDLPGPGCNPVRPPAQSRAAMHHLGGDMDLFMEMLSRPIPGHYSLKMVFSVWPREGRIPRPWVGREEPFSLLLRSGEEEVPGVVSLSPRLFGYCLLCCHDLAGRVGACLQEPGRLPPFGVFASAFPPPESCRNPEP